jgi:LPS-assembly protein
VVRLTSIEENVPRTAVEETDFVLIAASCAGANVWLQGRGLRRFLHRVYLLITITVLAASHPHLAAQEVTSQAPPPGVTVDALPDGPDRAKYPDAIVLPEAAGATDVVMESSGNQSKTGTLFVLDRDVVVTYGDRKVAADHIEYDSESGDVTATGHVRVTGGPNQEMISASHGTMNIKAQTGRFYDVVGSVGLKTGGHTLEYASSNPFLFTGRMVVKKGPQDYEIFDGTLTSCQMARPDWLLSAGKFSVDSEKARASNSVFHLLNVPLLYLPYVTHPVDSEDRQSGFLIPVISNSSSKGIVLGEEVYWAINRSMDLTAGTEYFSQRGWSPSMSFRYKGIGSDFATARFRALYDRGYYPGGGTIFVNQGGQDVTYSGRHDFSAQTRVVADAEYLSSYVYREAFTANFNQAVSTDILSTIYGVHEANGFAASFRGDRYQGLKRIPVGVTPGQEVKIFHAPSIDFTTTDHALGTTGLEWSLDSSAAGLKRTEPNFTTSGIVERLDVHPELAYPMHGGGWNVRPSLGLRDTLYSRSRKTPYTFGGTPVESPDSVNRADVEVKIDIRPPVLERTFDSGTLAKLFRHDVKHTIEPEVTYRYVNGIGNFLNVLRFDGIDVASDTNELEYGVTQRLYLRPTKTRDCITPEGMKPGPRSRTSQADPDEPKVSPCGNREFITWRVTQKYYFDQLFGGAVLNGRRNIFDTTLNLSGIAFLTEPRAISPLVSRLRVKTSEKLDLEWNFDLDTGAKKFTANNFLADIHEGNIFGGISYARLNAPGRAYSEGISSTTSDFSQLRVLGGYGSPTKLGAGLAGSVNLDLKQNSLQYGAVQASYNWDCCGFSVEYRKYELGSVRNEGVERFSFTLKNIGSAGDLKRADRLF